MRMTPETVIGPVTLAVSGYGRSYSCIKDQIIYSYTSAANGMNEAVQD